MSAQIVIEVLESLSESDSYRGSFTASCGGPVLFFSEFDSQEDAYAQCLPGELIGVAIHFHSPFDTDVIVTNYLYAPANAREDGSEPLMTEDHIVEVADLLDFLANILD